MAASPAMSLLTEELVAQCFEHFESTGGDESRSPSFGSRTNFSSVHSV
jgi:hypothetical protein